MIRALIRNTVHGWPLLVLTLSLLNGWTATAQVQNRPVIGPEHRKLEAWAGKWKYSGTLKDSPLGPGGDFTGSDRAEWILDGQYLLGKGKDKGVYGGKPMTYEAVTVVWYDPTARNYRQRYFDNDGFQGDSTMTVSGNTWTSHGSSIDRNGRKYLTRATSTFSSNGKSRTTMSEISFDEGKTWAVLWELTAKKR